MRSASAAAGADALPSATSVAVSPTEPASAFTLRGRFVAGFFASPSAFFLGMRGL